MACSSQHMTESFLDFSLWRKCSLKSVLNMWELCTLILILLYLFFSIWLLSEDVWGTKSKFFLFFGLRGERGLHVFSGEKGRGGEGCLKQCTFYGSSGNMPPYEKIQSTELVDVWMPTEIIIINFSGVSAIWWPHDEKLYKQPVLFTELPSWGSKTTRM